VRLDTSGVARVFNQVVSQYTLSQLPLFYFIALEHRVMSSQRDNSLMSQDFPEAIASINTLILHNGLNLRIVFLYAMSSELILTP
jgi:hypothetical protein